MLSANTLKSIYLYDEGIAGVDFKKIRSFIAGNFGNIPVYLRKLKKKAVHTTGLLFDFVATLKAFTEINPAKKKDSCHIILTPKLFASLDEFKKPHIRASIYGFPSVISLSGIVEGPAKPKAYYRYKQRYAQLGIWEIEEAEVKKKFKGKFIDYKDKRLTNVLKGYIAQGLFYFIFGDPFCNRRACRLYNAHWQEDLIYSQIRAGKFCRLHQQKLQQLP